MTRISFLFAFFITSIFVASAQQKMAVLNPVKWEFSYEENKDTLILQMTAVPDPDWHIYSQQVPADGPVPTSFKFNEDEKLFKLSGSVSEPDGEKKMDEAFGVEIKSFDGKVVFTQKVLRLSKEGFKLTGEVEYMTCNNMQCLPPKVIPFAIVIPAL